jgi:hypothetical protein
LFDALFLKRSRSPEGGIEGNVISFAIRRAGLDVTTALSLSMRTRTSP